MSIVNNETLVNAFYLAYYGRPADPSGLAFWSQQLARANGDVAAIAPAFTTSEEATVRFGASDVTTRITDIYEQLFDRAPDSEGLAFWTKAIEQGHASMADIAILILQSAEQAQGEDGRLAVLRQQAAESFTAEVVKSGIAYDGYAAIEASRVLVKAVTLQSSAADIQAMVKATAKLADIAHDNPKVLEAIATGTTLVALFDTARGEAEPVNLVQALADVAQAAAGSPSTLDSLLRGGGMGKVLDVMPSAATLHDVVDALATGGLPAAVEVVYPSAPAPAPAPAPEPVLAFTFDAGRLTLSGDASHAALVDLDARTVAWAGRQVALPGEAGVAAVSAVDYAGQVTLSGKVGMLAAVLGQSTGVDAYRILDGKDALFSGPAGARTLVPEAVELIKAADKVTLTDTLSASERALLDTLQGFDAGKLVAQVDLVAPEAGALRFVGIDAPGTDGAGAFTSQRNFSLALDGAEAGARIAYQVRDAQGAWHDLPSAALSDLAEGSHIFRGVVTDAAGNVSHTGAATVTVDLSGPVLGTLAFGPNDGTLSIGESVELTVSLSEAVTVGQGAALKLNNGGSAVYVSGSGTDKLVFKYTPAPGQDGTTGLKLAASNPFSGSIADRAGNLLAADAFHGQPIVGQVAVVTTAPAQTLSFTTITQSGGESASVVGTDAPLATNLGLATVRASLSAELAQDERVEYSLDGGANWSRQGVDVTGTAVSIAGVNATTSPTLSLRIVDAAGNAGASVSRAIVYDIQEPDGGKLEFLDVTESPLDSKADNVTNMGQMRIAFQHSGAMPADDERWEFSLDGTTWSTPSYEWIPFQNVLRFWTNISQGALDADGNRVTTVSMRVVDAAGNSRVVGSADVVYDSHAAAPTITLDQDTAGPNGSNSDRVTSVGTYTVGGIEQGGRVEYSLTGTDGWSATAPVAAEGPNTVYVRQIDAAGNISANSSLAFTLDTSLPNAPGVTLVSDTGSDATDKITKSGQVAVGGLDTAAGSAWEYKVDGGDWTRGGIVDGQGNGSLSVTGDGAHTVLVRQYDAAGNVSGNGTLVFTLDTTAVALSFDQVQGWMGAPNKTDREQADVIFSYSGELGSGGKVEYRIDGGAWTADDKAVVDELAHKVTLKDVNLANADPLVELRVTDLAGNASTASVTVDGPFTLVPPSLVTEVTPEGLKATSSVNGSLYSMFDAAAGYAVYHSGGSYEVSAGVQVLLWEQPWTAAGPLAVGLGGGRFVYDASERFYLLGTIDDDALEYHGTSNVAAWGFGGNDTIVTGAGNDVVFAGDGGNTITTGKGADRIDVSRGANTLNFSAGDSSVANGIDVVDFGAGNMAMQKFVFSGPIYEVDGFHGFASPTDGSNAALLAALNNAFGGPLPNVVAAVIDFVNQDRYVVVDLDENGIDANDMIIKLVGTVSSPMYMNDQLVFGSPP